MTDQRKSLMSALIVWQQLTRDADRRKHSGMTKLNLFFLLDYDNLVHALGEHDAFPCPKCYMERKEVFDLSPMQQGQEFVSCHACGQKFHTTQAALERSFPIQ